MGFSMQVAHSMWRLVTKHVSVCARCGLFGCWARCQGCKTLSYCSERCQRCASEMNIAYVSTLLLSAV